MFPAWRILKELIGAAKVGFSDELVKSGLLRKGFPAMIFGWNPGDRE